MESIFKLSVMVNMVDNMTSKVKNVNKSTEVLKKGVEKLNLKFKEMVKSSSIVGLASYSLTKSLLSPVTATFETQKALGELSSVGIENLEVLEESAKKFSNEFAGTTKSQFLTAAYDIKSGISSLSDEGVAKFTELAGLTAKATKSTTEEMTSLFATGYGIYKNFYSDLSDIEFGEMFSSGISKSVQQFKTTGSEMASAISSLGAAATNSNVPLEEQLSILGMLQATMSGSEAGTKYVSFLSNAASAGEKLGLKFTDANNQLLSMPEILELLKGKFGETIDASEKIQLKNAFGTEEAVKLIDLLYNKTGDLQTNILTIHESMGKGTEVTNQMANAINSTSGEKFQILKQRISNCVEEIGNNMLPTVNQWLEKGLILLEHIDEFIATNGELIGDIAILGTTVLGAVGAFKICKGVAGGVINVIEKSNSTLNICKDAWDTLRIKAMYFGDSLVNAKDKVFNFGQKALNVSKSGLTKLKTGLTVVKNGAINFGKQIWKVATTQLPAVISSCWAWTVALLTNPVTWVVVGIVALITVLILLWQNWDKVSSWLKDTWNGIVEKCVAGWDWLKNVLGETPNWLLIVLSAFMPFIGLPLLVIKNWDTIKGFFVNLWNNISESFTNFFTNFLPNLLESGKKIMMTIADGIGQAIMYPINKVKEGFTKLRQLLPFSDAKEGPLSDLTLSGSRIPTTIAEGIEITKNVPAQFMENSFTNVAEIIDISKYAQERNINFGQLDSNNKFENKKVDREIFTSATKEVKVEKNNNGNTIINLQVDISNVEELNKLLKLAKELEAEANKNNEESDVA